MLFTEALQKLQDGAAMRRAAWPEIEGYLKLMPGMGHVWKIVLQPAPNAGNFIFSVEDFISSDWVEFTGFDIEAPAIAANEEEE
jgi:hypothetical protein